VDEMGITKYILWYLVPEGRLAYKSWLAVAHQVRRPLLAVLPAGKTSLRPSRLPATHAGVLLYLLF